mmetsp:Transcript_87064/g.281056  ORF Transcript_87064/g.281056 Transcript_87064/m.281056 type:complete len:428 (+) Transcript_87064:1122-2405(+)
MDSQTCNLASIPPKLMFEQALMTQSDKSLACVTSRAAEAAISKACRSGKQPRRKLARSTASKYGRLSRPETAQAAKRCNGVAPAALRARSSAPPSARRSKRAIVSVAGINFMEWAAVFPKASRDLTSAWPAISDCTTSSACAAAATCKQVRPSGSRQLGSARASRRAEQAAASPRVAATKNARALCARTADTQFSNEAPRCAIKPSKGLTSEPMVRPSLLSSPSPHASGGGTVDAEPLWVVECGRPTSGFETAEPPIQPVKHEARAKGTGATSWPRAPSWSPPAISGQASLATAHGATSEASTQRAVCRASVPWRASAAPCKLAAATTARSRTAASRSLCKVSGSSARTAQGASSSPSIASFTTATNRSSAPGRRPPLVASWPSSPPSMAAVAQGPRSKIASARSSSIGIAAANSSTKASSALVSGG